jgi:hypothetical protein
MALTMSDERRSSQRKQILLEAKWESMSRTHEARVDDISLGGCFVNTYGKVELGERVDLQIELPSGEWLPLSGCVASYQPGVGFGLSFDSLTEEESAALKELILTAKERKL